MNKMTVVIVSILLLAASTARAADGEEPPVASEVHIQGCKDFKEKKLLRELGIAPPSRFAIFKKKPKYTASDLQASLEDLRLLYNRRGYFEVEVQMGEPSQGRVTFTVSEGEPCRVAEIKLDGMPDQGWPGGSEESLLEKLPLKEGAIFTVDTYEGSYFSLLKHWKEEGYAFAEVKQDALVDLDRHAVAVTYTSSLGERVAFGPVEIDGAGPHKQVVLRRAMAFERGQPFKQSLLDRSAAAVYRFGLFDYVSLVPVPGGDDPGEVTIKLVVKEGKSRKIKLGAGYGNLEGPRVRAGWESDDLGNRLAQFGFDFTFSQRWTEGAGYFRKPYLLGKSSTFEANIVAAKNELEEFKFRSTKVGAGIEQRFWKHCTLKVGAALERVKNFDLKEGVPENFKIKNTSDAKMASFSASLTLDTTDGIADPRKGFKATLFVEPTQVKKGRTRFTTATLDGRAYAPMGDNGWVVALRLKLGEILSSSPSNEIPLTKRFYAGGAFSLRGYRYASLGPLSKDGYLIGGNGLVEASAELRFPLKGDFTGVAFVDAGNAYTELSAFKAGDVMCGAGFGFRYKTPVGPLGVDIAFKLKDWALDNSRFALYIYIGYAF